MLPNRFKALLGRKYYGHARDERQLPPSKFSHSIIIPFATYSPWGDDPAFLENFNKVRGNTLVDMYRAYELWALVGQTASLGGDILEVGVWRGGTGCLMGARAQADGRSSTVFLCDTFTGVVKAGVEDTHYKGGEHSDTSLDIVRKLAADMSLRNIEVLQGIFPDESSSAIENRQFSLCHVDVDAYQSAQGVVEWVWPRLKVGGIVIYDDYGFHTCEGITQLVNERSRVAGSVTLHNLNGHAVVIKTA